MSTPIDLLNRLQKEQIKRDAKNIIEDPELSLPIIYRRFIKSDYDPTQGTSVTEWVDVDLRAYRGDIPLREIAYSNSVLNVGDQVLLFDGELLGGGLSTNDRILILLTNNGEASLVEGSPIVNVGDGQLKRRGVQGGDFFKLDEFLLNIKSVDAEDQLTLESNWASFGRPGTDYGIYRLHSVVIWQEDPLTKVIRVTVRRLS